MVGDPTPALLALQSVRLEVEGKILLRELSLEVREGEMHALIGANGAGKSSLAWTASFSACLAERVRDPAALLDRLRRQRARGDDDRARHLQRAPFEAWARDNIVYFISYAAGVLIAEAQLPIPTLQPSRHELLVDPHSDPLVAVGVALDAAIRFQGAFLTYHMQERSAPVQLPLMRKPVNPCDVSRRPSRAPSRNPNRKPPRDRSPAAPIRSPTRTGSTGRRYRP
jgi:hypothetical protein